MRAVSNTSPISNLAIIDRLGLLRDRYGTVTIPAGVKEELDDLTHSAAKERILAAINDRWLKVKTNATPTLLSAPLDPGETAAIALALQEKADVLLMDELRGREVARSLGIKVAGILGELVHAKLMGRISSVKAEIARLRKEARFFIDPTIEQFILGQVGEV
jgi:uncharacterized protein